jgi:hypothetical protein
MKVFRSGILGETAGDTRVRQRLRRVPVAGLDQRGAGLEVEDADSRDRRVQQQVHLVGAGLVGGLVTWMAVALAAVALVVGIPVGLLCGREAWGFFAGQLGISDVTRTPVLSFVLLAVAGLALAAAIASVPGISASRIRPADALRAE